MGAGKNTYGHSLVKSWRWLDGFSNVFGAIVAAFYRIPGTRPIKDLLHGTWPLHHPLHPAVTDLTIGGYTAMFAMDMLYLVTKDVALLRAADFLLIGSFLTSLVSIVSGLTDWNETFDDERRTGMLHGLLMTAASVAFVVSLVMRLNGGIDIRGTAIIISSLAWALVLIASFFGGELVFGFGTGVNRQAWSDIGGEWETLDVRAADLNDRTPVVASTKNGVALFVAKVDDEICVIANLCTHAGGPLNEGSWVGKDRCEIQCPWHASRFCVKDGSVHGGPATFPQPRWTTRVAESGGLEVKATG